MKTLYSELLRMSGWSLLIYTLLFALLWAVEQCCPELSGTLLRWQEPAFLVGIPASILGTAYVLTIRNPRNYLGFYLGIVMSLLLSLQFYLQGSFDLMVLYLAVFIPFQTMALLTWRRDTHRSTEASPIRPAFLSIQAGTISRLISLVIILGDYALATYYIYDHQWGDQWGLKLCAAITIASSFFANYWMIYKKNDAWLCWVYYCLASIVMFILIGNIFSIVLFAVMLVVNMSAQLAWLRMTRAEDFGWAGRPDRIQRFRQTFPIQRGHIVDVLHRRIYDGEIVVLGGKIVSIREVPVPTDAPYILPGFVDSHIHIESTLLLPEQYAPTAVSQGTTTVITDPHEVANVLGEQGLQLMMDSARKVRFHFHFGLPSCVPATPFETSGASLDATILQRWIDRPEVYGLGEMMNVPGVLRRDPETMARIRVALDAHKRVDGHCPRLEGEDLRQYAAAGITVDHECTTLEEGRRKLAAGMIVQIREGSAACDLDALMPLLQESDDHLMFCSDDKYPDEISLGYINDMVVRCIRRGMPLWSVLNAACVTPVRHYGLDHGLLQVGDKADFICVRDLVDFSVISTFIDGHCVFAVGQSTDAMFLSDTPSWTLDDAHAGRCPNHFLAQPISTADIVVPAVADRKLKVIGTTEGSLITTQMLCTPKVENGQVVADTDQDVLKLVCLSRHSVSRPVVGFIHGFGLKRGAMASTIGHDSHNIIAIGTTDEDIVTAINHLVDIRGGLVICDGPEVLDMELAVAGLMSVRTARQCGKRHAQLKAMAARLGCRYRAPFMTMAFMPLPVIPELKITDRGLFDATRFEYTDLWEN